jgi:hypothetical protein
VPATLATATKPATPFTPAKTALTAYTYDAIGQSKQVTYPNGDKLAYTYSPAHKLLSIKWNGIEQYTPTAGISGNLAALITLGGYSGITNPELAYKLGVNASTLYAIDAAPKVLTETANAAAYKTVRLAKEAVVGREARAQAAQAVQAGIRLGGWIGSRFSLPASTVAVQLGFVDRGDGYVYNPAGDRVCSKGKDPDDCEKKRARAEGAKARANGLNGCKGGEPAALRDTKTAAWKEAVDAREDQRQCFNDSDTNHAQNYGQAQ